MQTRQSQGWTDEQIDKVANLFKMFSDPTRVRTLEVLLDGEMCVSDIAARMDMSAAAISHHLRILHQNNLASSARILSLGLDHVNE